MRSTPFVPANAGTQFFAKGKKELDARFRGHERIKRRE